MNRLNALATILVLLMPAAHAVTAKLVVRNGEHRQEITVVSLSISEGLVIEVTKDSIMSAGFEAQSRAPPDALKSSPAVERKGAATSGTEAPIKGIGERR